jgi:hypothetical protein
MGAPFPVPGVNALIAPAGGAQFFASFTPSQVHDWRYVPFASDAKITISTDTATSLTRFALSTGYSPFALRSATDGSRMLGIIRTTARRLQDGWYTIHGKNCADMLSDTLTSDEAEWCNRRRLADEWPLVFHTWIPAVNITGAVDVFPYGSVPDPANPSQRLALEPYGGLEGQLTLVFRPREWVELDLMGSASRKRPTGAPNTALAAYYGGAFTPSFLVWSWLDRSRIDRFGDYVKLGFIPGLALGASLQALWCPDGADCVGGKTFDVSVSPFVDVRIKAQLQVRFSVPIEYFETAPRKDTAVTPTLTLAGAVGSP